MARYLPWLGLAFVSGVSFFLIKNFDRSGTRSRKNFIQSLLAKTKNDVDKQQPLVSSESEIESHVDEQKPLISSVETTERQMVDEKQPLVSAVETVSEMVAEQQPSISSKTEVVDEKQPLISSKTETARWLRTNMVDELIISFHDFVPRQSDNTAKQYLQATNWNLEEAVKLFYTSTEERPSVRAVERPNVRAADNSELDTLYRPPKELICKEESFDKVKDVAATENKWLIVNVQSKREFSSNTLNLDTWRNEAITQTIAANFIFWQVYDDVTEGQRVCTFYELTSFPAILILNPYTGEKKKLWSGMKEAWELLEDLVPFMDAGPEITKKNEKVSPASPDSKDNMTATVARSDTDDVVTDNLS